MKRVLISVALASIVLAGCGGSLRDKVVGTWKIDMNSLNIPGVTPEIKESPQFKQFANDKFLNARLEFKADGTAVPTNMGDQTGGKWSLSGEEVVLEDNKGKAKDIKVTVDKDGGRLHFHILKNGKDDGGFDMVKA